MGLAIFVYITKRISKVMQGSMTNKYKLWLVELVNYLCKIHYIARFTLHRESRSDTKAILQIYARSMISLVVLWFVFTYGFRVKLTNGVDFFNYFAPAFLAWTLVSDSMLTVYSFVKSNTHIVENSTTKLDSLLLAHTYKILLVHMLTLLTVGLPIILLRTGSFAPFELLIAILFTCCISIACSFVAILLAVEFEKFDFFLPSIVNIFFWLTPLVWAIELVPERFHYLMRLNPFDQMANMYREALGVTNPAAFSSMIGILYIFIFAIGAALALRMARTKHFELLDALK